AMGIRRKDVAPFDPLVLVLGLFARSLFPASALRRAIASIVPKTRFENLKTPLTVTATDLDSGELLLLGGPERRRRDIALGDALRIMMAEQTERVLADWPKDGPRLVYVRAVAEREATFAVERIQEYVELGYQATKKALG